MKRICLIPARMGSSRFPGKPLAPLLGVTLIEHVYLRCRLCESFDRIAVATCDQEIADVITARGGEAIMTTDTHDRCTDRIEEAVRHMNLGLAGDDLVVMVQGDEILVSPEMLQQTIDAYDETGAPVINLISPLFSEFDHNDVNTVKVVFGVDRRIIFMSRAPIPSTARTKKAPLYQQTGVIAFKSEFLKQFSSIPQTPLEIVESIDMLRVLENGLPIIAVTTETETIGVDTEADRARAEQRLTDDPVTRRYMDL